MVVFSREGAIIHVPRATLRSVLKAGEYGERRITVSTLRHLEDIDDQIACIEEAHPDVIKGIVLMQLHRARAVLLEGRSLYENAIESASKALAQADGFRYPTVEVPVLAQLGNLERRAGRLGEAEVYLVRAAQRAEAEDISANNSLIFYELGYIAYLRGRFKEAADWFEKSITAAQEDDDTVGRLAGVAILARQHTLNGSLQLALELVQQCDTILRQVDTKAERDWIHRWKMNNWAHEFEVRINQGKLRRAHALLTFIADGARGIPTARALNRIQSYYVGQLALARGQYCSAEQHLTEHLNEVATSQGIETAESASEPIALLGKALVRQRKLDEANSRFEWALQLPPDLGNRRGQAWAAIDLAATAHKGGDDVTAKRYVEMAISATEHHYAGERQIAIQLRGKLRI